MKGKWILSGIFLLVVLFSCSRLPPKPELPSKKRQIPVFEVFGYARCSNCPIVEHATDSLKKVYTDSIIILEYHLRIAGDTISPQNIETRASFYNIGNAVPITIIQGIYRIEGAESDVTTQFSTFKDYFLSLRERTDSVGLLVTIDTVEDSIEFTIDVDSAENVDTATEVFILLLTEDSVRFIQGGATDTIYNNVVKYYRTFPVTLPFRARMATNMVRNRNFIVLIQDSASKNIVSGFQRRF